MSQLSFLILCYRPEPNPISRVEPLWALGPSKGTDDMIDILTVAQLYFGRAPPPFLAGNCYSTDEHENEAAATESSRLSLRWESRILSEWM